MMMNMLERLQSLQGQAVVLRLTGEPADDISLEDVAVLREVHLDHVVITSLPGSADPERPIYVAVHAIVAMMPADGLNLAALLG